MQINAFRVSLAVISIGIFVCVAFIFHDNYRFNQPWDLVTKTVNDSLPKIGIEVHADQTKKPVRRSLSFEERINEAELLIEHQYYSQAALELRQAINLKPDAIKPYLLLASIYLRTDESEKLQALLSRLEKVFVDHNEVNILQVQKYIQDEDFPGALKYIQDKNNPSGEILFYQALLNALKNDHAQAFETLNALSSYTSIDDNESSGSDKEETTANFIQTNYKKKIRDLIVIYDEFENFADGTNAHLLALLSKVLSQHNEPIFARYFAEQALKEEVEYIDAWLLRGYALFMVNNYQAAVQDFNHAYQLDPVRPRTLYFLGLAYYELGDYIQAGLFFEKALENNFDLKEEVRWKLIEVYRQQKKFDKAVSLYESLITPETDTTEINRAIDLAVRLAQSPEKALNITTKLIAQDPTLDHLNLHVWALIANKKHLEALELLEEIEEQAPDQAQVYINYGLVYEEQDRYSKAKTFYKKAYEVGKDDPEQTSAVNLAATRYNDLIRKTDRPDAPEVTTERNASSP